MRDGLIKIGVDCHNLEENRTGVGRYLQNILEQLTKMPSVKGKVVFYLYFKKKLPSDAFLQATDLFVPRVTKLPFFKASFLIYFFILLPYYYFKDGLNLFWFPCYIAPITFCGKTILTIHDVVYERFPETVPWRYRIFYKLFSRFGAKTSLKILTVSEFSRKEISSFYKIPLSKIVVTPLGVDEKFNGIIHLTKEEARRKIRNKYDISQKYILFLGQIFQRRRPLEIIKSFYKISRKFPDYQFLIVGRNLTNPYLDIDQICVDFNNKVGRRIFLRYVYADEDDLVYLYRGAEFFVYLSDYEGFGLPPLEAQRCGTPVVSSKTSSLIKILKKGAILIKNNSSLSEISHTFGQLLINNKLREKLGQEAYKNSLPYRFEKASKDTLSILLYYAKQNFS